MRDLDRVYQGSLQRDLLSLITPSWKYNTYARWSTERSSYNIKWLLTSWLLDYEFLCVHRKFKSVEKHRLCIICKTIWNIQSRIPVITFNTRRARKPIGVSQLFVYALLSRNIQSTERFILYNSLINSIIVT